MRKNPILFKTFMRKYYSFRIGIAHDTFRNGTSFLFVERATPFRAEVKYLQKINGIEKIPFLKLQLLFEETVEKYKKMEIC